MFTVIGERINTTLKKVQAAVAERDAGYIQNDVRLQTEAVKTIMTELQGVHTTGGLSNASYGLPQRKIINRCFLAMMIANGYDSAIMDPLDRDIMSLMHTADMLAGNDKFCMNFIKGVRADKIVA